MSKRTVAVLLGLACVVFGAAYLQAAGKLANEPLSLSGSDEVPEGFRPAIEEYYRSLARRQQPAARRRQRSRPYRPVTR